VSDAPRRTAEGLLVAARALAGHHVIVTHKGGVGQAVERALGLSPRNDEVDDPIAGVEVKTLPLTVAGAVVEDTYVTMATVETLARETWATSRVRRKLSCVLFVPVVRDDAAGRVVIGAAFLWRPSPSEEATLRADWEDLADLVARGFGFAVRASRGRALQLRPKAASSRHTRVARVADEDVRLRPQGFYLRRAVTQRLLHDAVIMP
jgi:DNA mismatch repair protein MutH